MPSGLEREFHIYYPVTTTKNPYSLPIQCPQLQVFDPLSSDAILPGHLTSLG